VRLTFDAASHTYRLDGEVVPSVTQVLDAHQDFSMIPPDVLERKRQLGEALHIAAAIEAQGGEIDEDSLDEQVIPYLNGWRAFVAAYDYQPIHCERQVAHPLLRYAGTLDDFGTMNVPRDGGPERMLVLIDKKATFAISPWVGPQTAAYLEALKAELKITEPVARFVVQLKPDGTFKPLELSDRMDWPVFCAALTVHNFKRRCK